MGSPLKLTFVLNINAEKIQTQKFNEKLLVIFCDIQILESAAVQNIPVQ